MLPEGPINKVLVFIDGSEGCVTASQYSIALSRKTGAEVIALYVVNVHLLEELVKARIFVKIEELDYELDLEQDGKRYLNYIAKLAKSKSVDIRTELAKGVVNKVVVDKVQELGVDLLVMGEMDPVLSRTDTFHDEVELILRKAKCSVLIVKNADHVERIYNALE